MTLNLRHYALLGLLAFLLALPGRMTLPPLDRDEPRYMEASEQMLLSHNFIDVRFQDKPRYLQPAGIYWLEAASTAAAEKIFGPSVLRKTWPYRIPSLLAATIIVPLTAWIGATLFGGATGLMAAGLLMVSTLFVAESHMATIDTVLLLDILCIEAALLCALTDRQKNRPTHLRVAIAYWLSLGVGLMLKGPVVLIPGFGMPLALWLLEKDRSWWSRLRPRWGWLLMIAVVVPWCVAIEVISGGDFFARAVGRNFLGKVAHGQEAHGLPPGFHLLVFGLAFWPGSLFAALAIPAIWKKRKLPQVRFLLSWIIPHWLVFELIATKLPHYVLPTYPAIAILTAASLVAWPTPTVPRWAKALFGIYGVLWTAIGLAFCFAGSIALYKLEHTFSLSALIALGGTLPLVLGAILMLLKHQRRQAAFCAIGAAVIAHAGLFLSVIPKLQTIRLSPRIAELFDDVRPCNDSVLVSSSYSEPSLVFLVGPNTQLIGPTEAAKYLHDHSQCSLALIDRKDEPAFTQALLKYGLEVVEYGRVHGLNYSNGHHLDLGLFAPR
ncbi:glycosyltransferase family 39 protein [Gluconobacter sp. LMG 31484]|uniref:Glycosyltransferase family 39 protein n=1 Tax=Gluconobacter vitians TaxID=2728102 RepID=A0ABR9Y4H9_9PROT|nr:glycosyltransferase family 39 protein [Gluconobacter vitians]MBF0858640.1 glycosyltransferase family 39 protein [Gluconobacter vitians]